jgi:hypothetical protein
MLPPPPLLREQARDGQQCRGTISCAAAATIIVVEHASRDGQQCPGTIVHAFATVVVVAIVQASKWPPTMLRHVIHTATAAVVLAQASKGGMTKDAKAPSSAPPPPPSSSREQVEDSQ